MPPRSDSKRARVETYLAERKPGIVDDGVWRELRDQLAPISDSYLRELLRASGVPLSPEVEGVRQDSLENAERTLTALARAYEVADPVARRRIRACVIDSKDHLKWALQRTSGNALKQELLLWAMTWLENPAVFESWLKLRRRGVDS